MQAQAGRKPCNRNKTKQFQLADFSVQRFQRFPVTIGVCMRELFSKETTQDKNSAYVGEWGGGTRFRTSATTEVAR